MDLQAVCRIDDSQKVLMNYFPLLARMPIRKTVAEWLSVHHLLSPRGSVLLE